jgi:hypothetical protein
MPESLNSCSFQDILQLHWHMFYIIMVSYWSQQYKRFYCDCVASSGHHILVHQVKIPRFTFVDPNDSRSQEGNSGL